MNENLSRLKALVAETNQVVANLHSESEEIEKKNQVMRAERFNQIKDYLMECYDIVQEIGVNIRVKIDTNVKYLCYPTTTYIQFLPKVPGRVKRYKSISFYYEYVDNGGNFEHSMDGYEGFGQETQWKSEEKQQYFFGCWWKSEDEKAFVDNWNQDAFEKAFASEIEKAITAKAEQANAEYQCTIQSKEALNK